MKQIVKSIQTTSDDMALINKYTRREMKPDEVFIFTVILCDNEVDRDGESFTQDSLEKLSELFLGKTGIFDHNPKIENQTIYGSKPALQGLDFGNRCRNNQGSQRWMSGFEKGLLDMWGGI